MGTLYRQRRAGAAVLHRNGGVLPGLSVKTNGLPTDDMSMREDTWTKFSPASPGWGLRGRGLSLLRDPQNSSGAKPATGARKAAPPSRASLRKMKPTKAAMIRTITRAMRIRLLRWRLYCSGVSSSFLRISGASPWTEPVLPPGFGPSFGGRQFWLDMVAPMGWPSLDGRLAAGGQGGAAA